MPRKKKKTIVVNDKMQQGYRYELTAPVDRFAFAPLSTLDKVLTH
jgi:hypothetical protein